MVFEELLMKQAQQAVFYADKDHTYTPEEIATLLDCFDLVLDLVDCSALGLIRGHRNEENRWPRIAKARCCCHPPRPMMRYRGRDAGW